MYNFFFFPFFHFQLKCIARVHDIYEEIIEKSIEEDVPNVNVLASGTSGHSLNSFQSFDQPQDGELSDQNGLYLTHQKGKRFMFVAVFIIFLKCHRRIVYLIHNNKALLIF